MLALAERAPACGQRVLEAKQALIAEIIQGLGELHVQVMPTVRFLHRVWVLLIVQLDSNLEIVVASTGVSRHGDWLPKCAWGWLHLPAHCTRSSDGLKEFVYLIWLGRRLHMGLRAAG